MLLVSLPTSITSFVISILLEINRFSRTIIDNFLPLRSKIIRCPSPLYKRSFLPVGCENPFVESGDFRDTVNIVYQLMTISITSDRLS